MTRAKPELSDAAITEIVRGLDPVDWIQVKLIANLPPERRILAGMGAMAFAMAALRGTLHRRFPELSQSQLNMKVLAHFTPIRMPKSDLRHPDNY
jgi:hypothetical protein